MVCKTYTPARNFSLYIHYTRRQILNVFDVEYIWVYQKKKKKLNKTKKLDSTKNILLLCLFVFRKRIVCCYYTVVCIKTVDLLTDCVFDHVLSVKITNFSRRTIIVRFVIQRHSFAAQFGSYRNHDEKSRISWEIN